MAELDSDLTDQVGLLLADDSRVIGVGGDGIPVGAGLLATGLYGFNGTGFDRLRSSILNGLEVDVTRIQGVVGISGAVTALQGTSPWVVSGTVSVGNFPATQSVTQGTSPWVVSGAVSVTNFPATQQVTQGTSPWVVSGSLGRTWDLEFTTDQVDASGSIVALDGPTLAALELVGVKGLDGLGIASASNLFPVSAAQSGAWTVGATQATSPWVVSGNVAATQSGVWSVGRTWTLAAGTDGVTVTQGTSPWVVSGTVTSTPSGTQDVNLTRVNGLPQTARDWSLDFANLDVALSTRAADRTLATAPFATRLTDGAAFYDGRQIRALTAADIVTAQQGTSPWVTSATQSGVWTVQQGTPPWSVSQSGAWVVTANQGTSPWVVSGTVAATQSGAWTTGRTWVLASGTDNVTVTQGTSPWVTSVSNFPGNYPTGAERNEDTPHVTGDLGYAVWAVRNDANVDRTSSDGDYSPFSTDRSGKLKVIDEDVKRGITDYRSQFDYDVRVDTNPVYIGKNTMVAADADPTWTIQRFTYDAGARVTDVQVLVGTWTGRTALLWV